MHCRCTASRSYPGEQDKHPGAFRVPHAALIVLLTGLAAVAIHPDRVVACRVHQVEGETVGSEELKMSCALSSRLKEIRGTLARMADVGICFQQSEALPQNVGEQTRQGSEVERVDELDMC